VEHAETYRGQRLIVISTEERPGSWTYQVDVSSNGRRKQLIVNTGKARYTSAEEARREGLSAATGAIDRARANSGKP
jgi:hypothetical protein